MVKKVGNILTATPAPATGDPTPVRSWQWLRDGAVISGATSGVYTADEADEGSQIAVKQIETNVAGVDTATSSPTTEILPFEPDVLFANSEEGAWYDPSDLSTLYQDAKGRTPVTGTGQPVGLMLDKSKGLTLGSELVTNGTFDSNGAGWTVIYGTFDFSGGTADAVGSSAVYQNTSSVISGKTYEIAFDITRYVSGSVSVFFNSNASGGSTGAFTGVGSYSAKIQCVATTTAIYVQIGGVSPDAAVDNISIRELPGNHAAQTTSAARPVLQARYNLLTYSEQFDNNTAWTKQNATITANTETAPDGTTTADTLTASISTGEHRVYNQPAVSASTGLHNRSVYAKAGTVSFISIANGVNSIGWAVYDLSLGEVSLTSGPITATMIDVGDGWYRCEIVGQSSGNGFLVVNMGDTALNARPQATWTAAGTETVHLWGAQIEDQGFTNVRPYQRIAAATDYATTSTMGGYVFPSYLDFDGVDDYLETNAVNFNTDKISAFAGFGANSPRSNNSRVFYVGDDLSWSSTDGSCSLVSGDGSTDSIRAIIYGQNINQTTRISVTFPYTTLATSLFDGGASSAAGEIVLRVDGAVVDSGGSTDSGLTNFGSQKIYISKSATSSAGYLYGKIYGLVIRGASSNNSEISRTESYLANKAGITL